MDKATEIDVFDTKLEMYRVSLGAKELFIYLYHQGKIIGMIEKDIIVINNSDIYTFCLKEPQYAIMLIIACLKLDMANFREHMYNTFRLALDQAVVSRKIKHNPIIGVKMRRIEKVKMRVLGS